MSAACDAGLDASFQTFKNISIFVKKKYCPFHSRPVNACRYFELSCLVEVFGCVTAGLATLAEFAQKVPRELNQIVDPFWFANSRKSPGSEKGVNKPYSDV